MDLLLHVISLKGTVNLRIYVQNPFLRSKTLQLLPPTLHMQLPKYKHKKSALQQEENFIPEPKKADDPHEVEGGKNKE